MLVASAEAGRRLAVVVNPPPRVDAGIVFALPIEAGRFEDAVHDATRLEAAGVSLHQGVVADRSVAWVVSGAGSERAARACQLLIDGHRPRVVVAAGFTGALAADLVRGGAVGPRRVVRTGREPIALESLATVEAPRPLTILTVDRVACSVAEKSRLARDAAADLVDMETWAIARTASAADVPCRCLKVVSDAAADELPDEIARLTEAPSPWRRLGAALRTVGSRPSAAVDLWRLWERAVLDSRTLADALARELSSLPTPPSAA